ncbi:ion transporter [Salipiger pallidus]|uniref:Ion transporter n=1 Tax=Salipiger pallidus TaxID=1775170 RepID=A0A8J2ZLS1_9RHOB|nr:potassium channel family protein [Salipiger pallidus]GGG80388.1 ion transporter [Salipiger pallidus]
MTQGRLALLRELYQGDSHRAHRFRYWLLGFDVITIVFVVVTSFIDMNDIVQIVDLAFGAIILLDFLARLAIEPNRMKFLIRPVTIADIVSIASFLAPLADEGLGFLRVLRTLRFLHTYQLMKRLRADFPFFRQHQDVFVAAINLMVFIFVMTGLVYATQHGINPDIGNYADALYFTITALTTTGFGDITLTGPLGKTISVIVMIAGVTLFLRLAQVLFRPIKVRYTCPECALSLHDQDAVHCKHCGKTLRIETEGQT